VRISKGFWMGQTEVTQTAYNKVQGRSPSYFKGGELPVESMSWDELKAYCEAIGGRLPTEAEWEYAARAGSKDSRYGAIEDITWYEGNSSKQTSPAGEKKPNGLDLFDMLGNVWEWVGDWYDENYYSQNISQNPQGPPTGGFRVLRGGSWVDVARYARASNRIRFGRAAGSTMSGPGASRKISLDSFFS